MAVGGGGGEGGGESGAAEGGSGGGEGEGVLVRRGVSVKKVSQDQLVDGLFALIGQL